MSDDLVDAALSTNVRQYFKIWYDGENRDDIAIQSFVLCLKENMTENKFYEKFKKKTTPAEACDLFFSVCFESITDRSKVLDWFRRYGEKLYF